MSDFWIGFRWRRSFAFICALFFFANLVTSLMAEQQQSRLPIAEVFAKVITIVGAMRQRDHAAAIDVKDSAYHSFIFLWG